MKIIIIGAGATGLYFQQKLSGLVDARLYGERELFQLTENARKEVFTNNPNFIFICTKANQLQKVGAFLSQLGVVTPILLFQNGLGIRQEFLGNNNIHAHQVGRGLIWFGVKKLSSDFNVITHLGGNKVTLCFEGSNNIVPQLSYLFRQAGFEVGVEPSILEAEWKKALVNLCINPVCAWLGLKNGEIAHRPYLEVLWGELLQEALAVAQAEGVFFNANEVRQSILSTALSTSENLNSLLQSVLNKAPNELPWLTGYVVRKAELYGISAPMSRFLLKQFE